MNGQIKHLLEKKKNTVKGYQIFSQKHFKDTKNHLTVQKFDFNYIYLVWYIITISFHLHVHGGENIVVFFLYLQNLSSSINIFQNLISLFNIWKYCNYIKMVWCLTKHHYTKTQIKIKVQRLYITVYMANIYQHLRSGNCRLIDVDNKNMLFYLRNSGYHFVLKYTNAYKISFCFPVINRRIFFVLSRIIFHLFD
jgi:hypothetical protein